jgi:hypothetical protein
VKPDAIGWILIGAGVLDLLVGFLVLRPRVPEANRTVVLLGLATGAAFLFVVGGLFLAGVLGS